MGEGSGEEPKARCAGVCSPPDLGDGLAELLGLDFGLRLFVAIGRSSRLCLGTARQRMGGEKERSRGRVSKGRAGKASASM